ncbi:DUF1828 domain-containing protein [Lacticaseibacillus paracasei]|uniref:DUF1828 domain-containing protein n=1 Tax=Lacticaseibacillus paracasei TaxID=1597 RepID=UPI0009A2F86D|nr:DUF1828 domain-containing protein [Lacticaseibacillus paracasei]OPH00691.1 hypothetical protein B4586_14105 [Lacticaseibacillus paracasei]
MNTNKWLDQYINWLRAQYKVSSLAEGDEISTPFTNSIGDNIRIYVQASSSGKVVFSDDGNTLNDLDMMGIDISNKTRQMMISNILDQYSVKLDRNNILTVSGDVKNIPVMKQRLLQTILRVDDLIQTRKGVVSNLFKQEVSDYFYENDIGVLPKYQISGNTGNPYTVDFAIPGSKTKSLRLIQAINRPTFERIAAESITFDDIKKSPALEKITIRYLIIYNDIENPLPAKARKLARQYDTELKPWSKKQSFELT